MNQYLVKKYVKYMMVNKSTDTQKDKNTTTNGTGRDGNKKVLNKTEKVKKFRQSGCQRYDYH